MKRMPRRSQRGLTLIESVLALAVFTTGVAALFGMITNVSQANRSMSFQNNALDLYTEISAQVRDAQCDYDGNIVAALGSAPMDPGLTIGPIHGGAAGPTAGSAMTAVGDAVNNVAVFGEYVPRMVASYVVQDATPAPVGANAAPPTLRLDVTIRQIMDDPAKDAMPIAPWVRTFPIEKICAPRYEGQPRGAFFP